MSGVFTKCVQKPLVTGLVALAIATAGYVDGTRLERQQQQKQQMALLQMPQQTNHQTYQPTKQTKVENYSGNFYEILRAGLDNTAIILGGMICILFFSCGLVEACSNLRRRYQ